MARELDGQAVLVTGGGTGIGKAIAARLAADGAAVTICGRTEQRLQDTVDEIKAAHPEHRVEYAVADVTVESEVEAAVNRAAEPTGQLTAVVANAGGGGMLARTAQQETAEFLRVLHVNLLGTFLTMKYAIPRIVQAGGGAVVAISSIAGHLTHRYFGAYPAAKAGIEQLVRNAADEYGADGVRCNAIRPGFVATELMSLIPRDSDIYASYVANTPLGRLGEPADVAALVRFLVGPDAGWLTGAVIDLDGGHSLRAGPDYDAFAAKS